MDNTQLTAEENNIMKEQLKLMPDSVTMLFKSDTIPNTVAGLKEVYDLDDEQARALENEISLTFLGLELISDFDSRAKQALSTTDEVLTNVLNDLTIAVFTDEHINLLKHYEATVRKLEAEPPKKPEKADIPKAPEKKPGIVANPERKVTPEGGVATIKKDKSAGKLVGLKQEQVESSVKGMRTMRGDINRLRPEDTAPATESAEDKPAEEGASKFTKPFKGS